MRLSLHVLTNYVGLLDDEDGATDLGTLEKKLAEKVQQRSRQASHVTAISNPTSPSQATSVQDGPASTPQSVFTSPEPQKDKEKEKDDDSNNKRNSSVAPGNGEEDVEALSEMMCSLVTNQSGETRYFGKAPVRSPC